MLNTHRFYIPLEQWNLEDLFLEQGEAHHCMDVLRLNAGARVVVFNGRGMEVSAEIVGVEKGRVSLRGVIKAKTDGPACNITLAQAVPKGRNMDLIVQKATELGVGHIIPLLSERTVVHLDNHETEKKRDKWKQVIVEAAKQSGQNWLPEISSPVTAKQFFAMFAEYELPLIASLQTDARSFRKVLANFREQHGRRPDSALMVIGPEGDFTPAEISWAKSAGCIPVSLGPIVLRTETAAIYSLSVLAYELQGPEA
jgi:16S rRNA (uracil1498-N3)-methyltransferase